MTAAKLSATQLSCLADAASGTLYRQRFGWAPHGRLHSGFGPGTIEALARRGLLKIDRLGGCAGSAAITKKGRAALAAQTRP